jgi:acid-sensing ion channel, other
MPYDAPEMRTKFQELRLGSSVNVVLKPKMITTAKELQHYPVSERKCYYSNERPLKYFNQYTPTNCEIECEVEYILEHCGCLPIYIESKNNFYNAFDCRLKPSMFF